MRSLDKLAAEQQNRVARMEKELVDYQSQADRPFEHEERLKELLARQSEINSFLDVDKGDQQGADSALDLKDDLELARTAPLDVLVPSCINWRIAPLAGARGSVRTSEPCNSSDLI